MAYSISDTETTGFKKAGQLVQIGQARIVQVAMLLCDEEGNHMTEFSTLIKPDGWTISEGAQAVHGISMEKCERYGIPMKTALKTIHEIMRQSKLLIFHNEDFDWGLFQIEYAYAGVEPPPINRYCTMLSSMNICNLPGKYGKPKWPKLAEALPILCGKELGDGAHDAMIDTKGCKDLFFELKRRGLTPQLQEAS